MGLFDDDPFHRIGKLPKYVFAEINTMRAKARRAGFDVVDLGMGNPDGATLQFSKSAADEKAKPGAAVLDVGLDGRLAEPLEQVDLFLVREPLPSILNLEYQKDWITPAFESRLWKVLARGACTRDELDAARFTGRPGV